MDFLNTAEKRDRRMVHLPMGRFGEAIEIAKGALFRKLYMKLSKHTLTSVTVASDDSSYMTVSLAHDLLLRADTLAGHGFQGRRRTDFFLCYAYRGASVGSSSQHDLGTFMDRNDVYHVGWHCVFACVTVDD
jgi:hypothetical protein